MINWPPMFRPSGAFIDGVEPSVTRSVGRSHQVLLVEDHPGMRRGMKAMLEDIGWDVVAECGTVTEARHSLKTVQWSVAVIDIMLPDGSGLELVEWLRAEGMTQPVLSHSAMPDAQVAKRAFNAGANGFLTKESLRFVEAAQKVASGGRYVSPEFAEELAGSLAGAPQAPHESLSERELQALLLIGQGYTPNQVAKTMECSINTYSSYRARILKKLGVTSTNQIMHYAWTHKLCGPLGA